MNDPMGHTPDEDMGVDTVAEQREALDQQGKRQKLLVVVFTIFTMVNIAIFCLQLALGAAFADVRKVVNRQEVAANYQRQVSQASRCVTGAQSGALLGLTEDLAVINHILLDPAARAKLADPSSEEAKKVALAQSRLDSAQPLLRSIFEDALKPESKRTGGSCPIPPVPSELSPK